MSKVHLNIKLKINFDNEFHIGGGKGNSSISSLVLKDINNKPYIPGSTVKGRLRYNIYQILNGYGKVDCTPFGEEGCQCLVCNLFGVPGNKQGQLIFNDLKLNDDTKEINYYSLKTGIRINRYLKVVKDEALFTIETTGKSGNLFFNGDIVGYLSKETYQKEISYIVMGLKLIKTLGSSQSRGLGWLGDQCQFNVYVDGQEINDNTLKEWGDLIEI